MHAHCSVHSSSYQMKYEAGVFSGSSLCISLRFMYFSGYFFIIFQPKYFICVFLICCMPVACVIIVVLGLITIVKLCEEYKLLSSML